MSYTDLRDFNAEYTVVVPTMTTDVEPALIIEIEKLGGGTVGELYTGTWRYRAYYGGHLFAQGQDLETGTAYCHDGAAQVLADSLAHSGGRDCDGSPLRERLCIFGMDILALS